MFGATRFTNSSHLLAIEGSKLEKPVRLPPGRVKLWTTPAVTGSLTWTNTVGVVRVVSLTATATGVELTRITSDRYIAPAPAIDELDIAALCPTQGLQSLPESSNSLANWCACATRRTRSGWCARAASGQAAAAPRRIMNSRRLMSDMGLSRPGVTTSSRHTQAVSLPHAQSHAEWPAGPWVRSELFWNRGDSF